MVHPSLLVGLGAAFSIFLSSYGAATASAQAGILAIRCNARTPSEAFRSFAPIIISGVLAIYGIIVAVILSPIMKADNLTEIDGYKCLCAGLAVGLACACSGFGIATFIDRTMYDGPYPASKKGLQVAPMLVSTAEEPLLTSSSAHQANNGTVSEPKDPPSWKFLMVLVFLEAIGLYGLIVALTLSS